MEKPKGDSGEVALQVLQQFRVIYGSMRQYFKEIEARCGISGSQMWILQEVDRNPGMGVTHLAKLLGVHQSTCSLLVDKLVAQDFLLKQRGGDDQRRVGLFVADKGREALGLLPGPAEGILPQALMSLPDVVLKTLNINLDELINHLPLRNESYAAMPLSEMLDSGRGARHDGC